MIHTRKLPKLPKSTVPVNKNCQYHQNNVPFQLNWQAILAACLLKISETSQSKNKVWVVSLNCILLFKWRWKKAELTFLCWRFYGELMQAVEFFSLKNNCICLQNLHIFQGFMDPWKLTHQLQILKILTCKNKTELNFLNPLKWWEG